MSRYSIEQIKTLPERVQDALFEAESKFIFEIQPELPDAEKAEDVKDIVFDVYFGTLKPVDLPAAIVKIVPDKEVAKEVTIKILGLTILPLADYFGADVLTMIDELGGESIMYRRLIPVHDIIEIIVEKSKIPPLEDRMVHRLCRIVESRVFNARTDGQVLSLLTGTAKTSGMGFTDDQAATLLATLMEELNLLEKRGIAILSDQKFEELPPEDTDLNEPVTIAEPETAAPPQNLPIALGETPLPSTPANEPSPPPRTLTDEEEITLTAKKMQERAHSAIGVGDVAQAVSAAIVKLNRTWPDEVLPARFRSIVDLYFRDLRDALETKSKMTMAIGSGGLGLDDADADQLLDSLAADLKNFRAMADERSLAEKAKFIGVQADKQQNAANVAAAAESQALDSQFDNLRRRAKGESVEPAAVDTPARVIPVVVAAPLAADATSAPATPVAPLASSESATAPNRPTVTDVRFSPRLMGPTEELRSMTLVDFRRLSRDPAEATLKIRDKIDLLGEQSFESKAAGIKAWQDSEPNRMYLGLLRQSLDGITLVDAIAAQEAKNLPVLAKNEFDAIMDLNRKLRFG